MKSSAQVKIVLTSPATLRIAVAVCAVIAFDPLCLFAQSDPTQERFEVASVRQHQGTGLRSGPLNLSDPLIRLQGYTVYGLLMDAFHLRDFQLAIAADIPKDDVYGKMYDIAARAPGDGPPSVDDVRAMLRNLLADRFRVRVHREAKEMQVFVLEVGRYGPKLKASTASGPCSVQTRLASDGRNDEENLSNCPIERLADRLSNKMDGRPILDKTGLTGNYDMRLLAAPAYRTRSGPDPADIDPITAIGDLGLRVVAQKSLVDIIVVDHLEKPTEN